VELVPAIFPDERGFFFESYRAEWMQQIGVTHSFVQDNQSFSKKGVVRGLHFQRAPHAQAKLVRVVHGHVLDVVVDLRKEEPTFGKSFVLELSAKKNNQLYIPAGFAHGLAALEDSVFFYKCSANYNKESDGGIFWNDPALNIEWPFQEPIVSAKDQQFPTLQELIRNSVI
jgi:dTDP-4-dehydrorhamnose 3,5-epimerase